MLVIVGKAGPELDHRVEGKDGEKSWGRDGTYEEGQHPGGSRLPIQLVCIV